jgi:hypothetical protein
LSFDFGVNGQIVAKNALKNTATPDANQAHALFSQCSHDAAYIHSPKMIAACVPMILSCYDEPLAIDTRR